MSKLSKRIRLVVGTRALPGLLHPVTVSIGCACQQQEDRDITALIQRADRVLFCAKGAGRNRVETAD
ncbi:diguanylate cyclase [Aeromonas veronii]|nr:diguanylate cyclase [Aeromonas veronii]